MDCVHLSDLEEGEILENEADSLSSLSESWSDEFGSLKNHCNLVPERKTKKFRDKENKAEVLLSSGNNGYKIPSSKCKLSDKSGNRPSENIIDLGLEEVSSDGDDLYEEDWKHSCDDSDYKVQKKKRSQFCGTAEDIMSEIEETISRKKSHCCHRKKKARYSSDKYKDNYNLWHHKTSHVKVKKPRRRLSPHDFNSDEIYAQERKRKKRASHASEDTLRKPKIRDFDEVRQTLLEKLRKQKAEEAKASVENITLVEEVGNNEIQEVEMGNTNYRDDIPASDPNLNSVANETNRDKEENDDSDLIELRLAALKSNSKQRTLSTSQKKVTNEEHIEGENGKSEGMDLDRYELLLRAEALKTALLKKHQKRLNKAKELSSGTNNCRNNNFKHTFLPLRGKSSSDGNDEKPGTSNLDIIEKNAQKKVESEVDDLEKNSFDEPRVTTPTSSTSSSILKKAKTKRKRRKSDSLQNNAKENTENADTLEEDDRTLRRQLLSDLLKKKSLKESDRKPILTDSVQTSDNQLPVLSSEQLKEKEKLSEVAPQKNSSGKVNLVNKKNSTTAPKIPKPEIKRIIVHLGSEDSSDEYDVEDSSAVENRDNNKKIVTTKESNESVRANYEKSVDLLLSQTWQKIEGEIAAARNAHDTPEAVYKHLPLSQRLEYIRLKQKIAEREKLKKAKESSNKSSSGSSNQGLSKQSESFLQNSAPVNEATKPLKSENFKPPINSQETSVISKNVPLNLKKVRNLNQGNSKQKTVAMGKLNVVKSDRKYVATQNGTNAGQTNQRRSLLQSSQAVLLKLKLLLKKIKIEKTIEENYEKEISKLKNQINLFEKKKSEQRFKIKKLADESLKTYKVIQQITNLAKKREEGAVEKKNGDKEESKKQNLVVQEVSKKQDLGVPEESKKQVLVVPGEFKSDEMRKAAEDSKNDISKVEDKKDKEVNESENICLPSAGHLEYKSPLLAFNKMSDNLDRVDPNVMVCQFDLMGVCKDKECTYQHFRTSQGL